ncbi:hypothetical protein M758_9G077700 [Ceratodon purpureus]|nr:hypothetical protein M758_9G077700 [Ceratodon purpureus]
MIRLLKTRTLQPPILASCCLGACHPCNLQQTPALNSESFRDECKVSHRQLGHILSLLQLRNPTAAGYSVSDSMAHGEAYRVLGLGQASILENHHCTLKVML